ncbi:MAG: carboxypeptidase-like regulatory domain-containing protein [Acidobacteriota bacterium]
MSDVVMKLEQGGNVSVVVVDELGVPISGARVSVYSGGRGATGRTDGKGLVHVGGVAAGRLSVNVAAPGFEEATTVEPSGMATAHIRLKRAACVDGRVVNEHGDGVRGVMVRATRTGSRSGPVAGERSYGTTTDVRGWFTIDGLPTGPYVVSATVADGGCEIAAEDSSVVLREAGHPCVPMTIAITECPAIPWTPDAAEAAILAGRVGGTKLQGR